jgi:acylphosphatase
MIEEIFEWKIRVEGLVQSVGFRAAASRQAEMYRIRGYARNSTDGSVEICAQGTQKDLESFVEAVRERPGLGSVEQVKIDRHRPEILFSSFEIRYTAHE